jgi:hypothetical protein
MKNNIDFNLVNIDSIPDLFENGIIGYYVKETKNSRPEFVCLKLGGCTIVKIYSTINEFDDWDEIGSLSIEKVSNSDTDFDFAQVGVQWHKIRNVSKLLIEDDNVRVECGLRLENENLQVINLLPSSFPNAIELEAEFYSGGFESECDFDEYVEEKYSFT